MALPNNIHTLLKQLYEEAEKSPDLQTSTRTKFRGKNYKIRVELANPDWPPGTVLIVMKPRN